MIKAIISILVFVGIANASPAPDYGYYRGDVVDSNNKTLLTGVALTTEYTENLSEGLLDVNCNLNDSNLKNRSDLSLLIGEESIKISRISTESGPRLCYTQAALHREKIAQEMLEHERFIDRHEFIEPEPVRPSMFKKIAPAAFELLQERRFLKLDAQPRY